MKATRAVLMLLGFVLGGYGVVLLAENPRVILFRIVVWALAGVVLHDLVFAPLCVALGFAGRRLMPRRWWAPVAVAALCTVVLIALSIPVFDKPGMRPDNLTVLDRNYHTGFWVSVGFVWACVPLYLAAGWLIARRRALPVGEEEVADQQGADDVGTQPPAMG